MKAMIGIRKKDTYEELINYLLTDQEVIRYPNRYAKQLRESPYLTQLDGEGLGEMHEQQERQYMEEQKENTIRQVASATSKSVSQIKAETAHQESFSQTPAATPDVKMSATSDTQTDDPVMAESGTGTDPPPPPTAGAIRMERGTSPLPPEHHYVHMNVDQPPPPPPPDASRIRVSTSDTRKPEDLMAQVSGGQPPPTPPPPGPYAKVRTKRGSPYDAVASASSSSGQPPPPPPPQAYYIGDTPMGNAEDRALSIEMRRADEERKLWETKQEKRARAVAAFRQHLMDVSHHAMKRAAEESSNSVAEQALEIAHAAAKARRHSEMQSKTDRLVVQEELKRQAALQAAQFEAAKRELSANHRAKADAHDKRVAAETAELEGQRQQIVAKQKALEKAESEMVSKPTKQPKQPKPKPVPRPKRQAAPARSASVDPRNPVRSASVETVNYTPVSRSRSRAKSTGAILPIQEAVATSVPPVKNKVGRPRTKTPVSADEVVKKPRGRPKSRV